MGNQLSTTQLVINLGLIRGTIAQGTTAGDNRTSQQFHVRFK